MSTPYNQLIAYDTSTGEIIARVAQTRGLPDATVLVQYGYNSAVHALTASMNTYDADDFDSHGNLTTAALEKFNLDATAFNRLVVAKDVDPPTNSYDRVNVDADGKLSFFSTGPVPINYNCYLDATIAEDQAGTLLTDTATSLPMIPADGTTTAYVLLQKYDHNGSPTTPYGDEHFYIETTRGSLQYRRVQLDANGAASLKFTAGTEEGNAKITVTRYFPGPIPTGVPATVGCEISLFVGEDNVAP
jgi:hypothetical protein